MAGRCPYCENEKATKVAFTPWGGVVGPFMLSLVRCVSCSRQYNGKSGRKVEKAIKLYTLATVMVLAFVAAWAIYEYAATQVHTGGSETAVASV